MACIFFSEVSNDQQNVLRESITESPAVHMCELIFEEKSYSASEIRAVEVAENDFGAR